MRTRHRNPQTDLRAASKAATLHTSLLNQLSFRNDGSFVLPKTTVNCLILPYFDTRSRTTHIRDAVLCSLYYYVSIRSSPFNLMAACPVQGRFSFLCHNAFRSVIDSSRFELGLCRSSNL